MTADPTRPVYPTRDYPAAPITSARPNRDYPGAIVVTVRCPLCRKTHVHGIPAGWTPDTAGTYGHRVNDCPDYDSGYLLTDPARRVDQLTRFTGAPLDAA